MKVLAVSHEASATGAPIFFLTLLQWLKSSGCTIDVIVLKDGVLRHQFESVGRCVVLSTGFDERAPLEALGLDFCQEHYDVIYFNTLETAHVLQYFLERGMLGGGALIVSHIHELEGTIQKYGAEKISVINKVSDLIFAASSAVKENLCGRHHFDEGKTHVVNSCSRSLSPSDFSTDDRSLLGRFDGKKMVLACGEISVGKGVDTFIRTAIELRRRYKAINKKEDFFFVWLGPDSYKVRAYFERDLEILGLNDLIQFFGHRDQVYPFFSACSVFYLSSRQDSFPLVCLEAASFRKPIVYFPDAGGIGSFLGNDAGLPALYQDFVDAADKIELLLNDEKIGNGLGDVAFLRWKTNYTADEICQKIFARIQDCKRSLSGGTVKESEDI